jgi:hypothetical protein
VVCSGSLVRFRRRGLGYVLCVEGADIPISLLHDLREDPRLDQRSVGQCSLQCPD